MAEYRLRAAHWRRYLAAVLVLSAATTGSYLVARDRADRSLAEEREELAERGALVVDTVELLSRGLESRMVAIAGLFRASDDVTPEEFERFAHDLGHLPGMRGYGYATITEGPQLDTGSNVPSGVFGFGGDGAAALAGPRQRAVLIYFVGVDPGDRPEGLDLASEPLRAAAISQSIATGAVSATPFLRLFEETDGDGVVAFLPVLNSEGDTTGLVSVPLDVSLLLERAMFEEVSGNLAWQITDVESGSSVGARHPRDSRVWSGPADFGDRTWTVTITPLGTSTAGGLDIMIVTTGIGAGLIAGLALLVVAASLDHVRARRDLESALRLKNRFIATVSHELRTPLAGVVGFLDLAMTSPELDDTERRELLSLAAGQADEMAAIIEDLLTAAKAEVTELTVTVQPIDLSAEILAVVRGHSERVEVLAEPLYGRVWADPARLRQVLRNLIKNAFRHGAAPVTIRAMATPGGAEIHVMDHGPGVPLESRHDLFRPFHPLTNSETQPGSLGLGLWISHRLMRLMGGDLTYRDDPQPTFVVSLRGVEVTDRALVGVGT